MAYQACGRKNTLTILAVEFSRLPAVYCNLDCDNAMTLTFLADLIASAADIVHSGLIGLSTDKVSAEGLHAGRLAYEETSFCKKTVVSHRNPHAPSITGRKHCL